MCMCFIIVLYLLVIIIYLYQQTLFSCKFGTVLTICVLCVCVCVCAYNTCYNFLALLIDDTRNDDIVEYSYYGDKMKVTPAGVASVKNVYSGTQTVA